jgi:hypothetical protein
MNHRTVLSVVGCSGSLALAIALTSPAAASPVTPPEANRVEAATTFTIATQAGGNTLRDALGCGCATCQASQRQPML